ncbi:hypothetical protein RhiirA5_418502 [Rhizophagus irregularis]|uniref:Uncharacterized protein n=1 Tax=Rhizophagus irregularis TaxID=588596 RepID=A0A2I1F7D1_9GLOM|nr:hypothetical protein RhiirA5_418502 [Rhizophagus irregularis]PKY30289.1 hypothetical protein RhiirB3_447299 [Rhizophagus irregularis]
MILTNDSSTSKDPLVICYCCWSRAVIKVNLRFYLNKDECKIPHSSSSFTLLRQAIKEKFEKLEKTEITDLYFEYFHGNSKKREIVENEFHFNMLVNNIQLNNKQEHTINYLKVQVKGKKVYDTLSEASPLLESNKLDDFVKQLKKKWQSPKILRFLEDQTNYLSAPITVVRRRYSCIIKEIFNVLKDIWNNSAFNSEAAGTLNEGIYQSTVIVSAI